MLLDPGSVRILPGKTIDDVRLLRIRSMIVTIIVCQQFYLENSDLNIVSRFIIPYAADYTLNCFLIQCFVNKKYSKVK